MIEIIKNHSLKTLNSWRIGGEADYFCTPTNIEELREAVNWAKQQNQKVNILGLGSNMLISDDGVEGLCICMRKFKGIEELENKSNQRLEVICHSGSLKLEVLRVFLKYNLPPALMFAGIPGDMGGGVVMNAGISESIVPREFVEVVDWVEVLRDDKILRFNNNEIEWTYRKSSGWQPGIITRVQVSWPIDDNKYEMKEKVKEANRVRVSKQPLEMPSCGSVFKNPKPHSSGKLIEEAGLKGYQIGGAQVSLKHANFIVNTGNASAKDMHELIEFVKQTVLEKFSTQLHTEVVYFGRW